MQASFTLKHLKGIFARIVQIRNVGDSFHLVSQCSLSPQISLEEKNHGLCRLLKCETLRISQLHLVRCSKAQFQARTLSGSFFHQYKEE